MLKKRSVFIGLLVAGVLAALFWVRYRSAIGPKHSIMAGSTLHLRTPSFAISLHPLKMADVESRQIATLLHAGLVFQDDTGTVRPVLAESWTHTGNTWRFKLKTNATFSDGTPVTAEDVVASLSNAMQPTSPWAWALAGIKHEGATDGQSVRCTGIQSPTPSEIAITEDKPSQAFLDALSGPAGWVLPRQAKEQPYGVVPGIGPFKVKEIIADNRLVLEARPGGAIQPRVTAIQFDFIPDDSVAAGRFLARQLDVLDLTSPQLVEMVADPASAAPKGGGTLQRREWDRVRILIVNQKRFAEKGFNKQQQRAFIDSYSSAIDRKRIAEISRGTAIALATPFPPIQDLSSPSAAPETLPSATATILTEPDAYSDLIASSLPKSIGKVRIDYKGVDKAVLIDSLIKGNFDLVSIVIEATVHSAEFWASPFTPGNPFTVFGSPIDGIQTLDLRTAPGLRQAGQLITREGNWIGILRERRLQAIRPRVSNILYSGSGQTNYAFVSVQ